jgi:murein L,D-transpeptidase YcbB/YkuD
LAQFYAERTYQPAWLNAGGLLPIAGTFVEIIKQAAHEGLRPGDYHDSELRRMLTAAHSGDFVTAYQWADLELLLTDAWLTYGNHLLVGRVVSQQKDQQWPLPGRSGNLPSILQEALETNRVIEALNALAPPYSTYAWLRTALAHYLQLENAGGWPLVSAGDTLEKGMRHPRVKELRVRLRVTGELTQVDSVTTGTANAAGTARMIAEDQFDEVLFKAVQRFQQRHGLAADGIVGPLTLAALNVPVTERIQQLKLNMERWRWLPEDLGQRYILVNIPDFTMQVIENGRLVITTKAIVGTPKRPTPVLSARMSYLVLNPRWYVPHSITVKDHLPKLRKDPYALITKKFHVYDAMGQEIDPGSVDWHSLSRSDFPYRLRQDPGPQNALGRVKFMFPNPYHVYLHDTPSRALFNRSQRTYSSGCVRVANAIELAEYFLKDNPRWTRDTIRAAVGGGKRQRTVYLPEEIPVHFFYWTAWVAGDGLVHFRRDIYNLDQRLTQVLQADMKPKQPV